MMQKNLLMMNAKIILVTKMSHMTQENAMNKNKPYQNKESGDKEYSYDKINDTMHGKPVDNL